MRFDASRRLAAPGRRRCTRARSISGSTGSAHARTPGTGSGPQCRSSPSAAPTARVRASRSRRASCAEAGYRVGTFTSPHLLRYNERIAVDGARSPMHALIAAFERIDAARGEDTLTFFEFNALAALLVFETRRRRRRRARSRHGRAAGRGQRRRRRRRAGHLDRARSLRLAGPRPSRRSAARRRASFAAAVRRYSAARDMPASIGEVAQQVGADLRRLGVDFDWVRSGRSVDVARPRSGASAICRCPRCAAKCNSTTRPRC